MARDKQEESSLMSPTLIVAISVAAWAVAYVLVVWSVALLAAYVVRRTGKTEGLRDLPFQVDVRVREFSLRSRQRRRSVTER